MEDRVKVMMTLLNELRTRCGSNLKNLLPNSAPLFNPKTISTLEDPDLRKLLLVTQLEFAQKYESLREERAQSGGRVVELRLKASKYANYTYELDFEIISYHL